MTERLRVLFAITLDRDRLLAHRDELLSRGEELYTEERFKAGTITVKQWPGEPEEWTSLSDLVDLMAPNVAAITSTELLEVAEGPARLTALEAVPPAGWRRFFKWLPLFIAIIVALIIASSSSAATIVGTSGDDTLDGTAIADVIKGRAGADLIRGHRGDDGLLGGRGPDRIVGGRGHDYIGAGGGDDVVDVLDGVFDLVDSCGDGYDVVVRDPIDFVALDCEES